MRENKVTKYIVGLSILLVVGLFIAVGSYFTVDAGQVAIKLRMGRVVDSYSEGVHFKLPVVDSVKKFNVRVQKDEVKTEAFSKDLQTVQLTLAINHKLQADTVISVYRDLGTDYVKTIISPMANEWAKAIVAKYSADSLISNRSAVATEIDSILKEKLLQKQVIVSDIAIVDFDFTSQFLRAVEEKQIAEQDAKKASNLVEKVKKEAEQKILQAEAEAKSLRLQKEAITPDLIKLRQVEAQIKAIEKWNGQMPQYMAGDMPFVMVK